MGKKIFVFTNNDGMIIGSFIPTGDQNADPSQPQIATDITILGQEIHEMEIPSHLPENVSPSILHQELAKIIAIKRQQKT